MKTVSEIAKSAGVTPQTIRNEIKKQNLSVVPMPGSKSFALPDDEADQLVSEIRERKKQPQKRENLNRKTKLIPERELLFKMQNQTLTEKVDALMVQIRALTADKEILTEQIRSLTEQIRTRDEQISNLILTNAQAQALHRETVKGITDKRGFFQRLFKRAGSDQTDQPGK